MKYIVFDISTQARRQKAKECARLLYKLQCPSWDNTYHSQFANPIYQSGTWNGENFTPDLQRGAIAFDETDLIPLRTNNPDGSDKGNGYEHIRQWVEFRFPNISQSKFDWIKQWIIDNETATTEQLLLENGGGPVNLPALPNWVEIQTQAEFDSRDWNRI